MAPGALAVVLPAVWALWVPAAVDAYPPAAVEPLPEDPQPTVRTAAMIERVAAAGKRCLTRVSWGRFGRSCTAMDAVRGETFR
jgi:hypothetical protein